MKRLVLSAAQQVAQSAMSTDGADDDAGVTVVNPTAAAPEPTPQSEMDALLLGRIGVSLPSYLIGVSIRKSEITLKSHTR